MVAVGNVVDDKQLAGTQAECRFPARVQGIVVDNKPIPALIGQRFDAVESIRALAGAEPFGVGEVVFRSPGRILIQQREAMPLCFQDCPQVPGQLPAKKPRPGSVLLQPVCQGQAPHEVSGANPARGIDAESHFHRVNSSA